MKRRGFTLIELLGIIIVISIIAIITRVVVLNVITSAKKESFKDTAYGIISALNYTYLNENLDQNHTSRMYIFPTDELDFNGKMPLGGQAYITADGDVSLAIYNEDWCAYRSFDEKKVSVIEYEEGACGLTTTGELALSKVEEDTD